ELVHPEFEYIRGHLDRRIVGGDKRPVEFKAPSRGMFAKIKRDGLPMSWIVQMQTYLWLDKSPIGNFVPFCADAWELLPFEIVGEPDLFHKLETAAVRFWNDHVLTAIPPAPVKA